MTKQERKKRREIWRERVESFRVSGQSVAAWCREHELKDHQMHYWLRRFTHVTSADSSGSTWLPVNIRDASASEGLIVRVGEVAIEVRPGFDQALLASVVDTLKGRC